jgi:hypothetical protein
MSKSKWKELPDWQNEADYAFLDEAPMTVWAWEALRRHEEYRKDWEEFQASLAGNSGKQLVYYDPPKPPEWTQQHWLNHVVSKNLEPKITTESQMRANKWGLREMIDPSQPYKRAHGFRLFGGGFPHQVQNMEDFEPMIEVIDHGDGFETQDVIQNRAIAAFNMTRPLKPQMDMLLEHLERKQMQLVSAGVLLVEELDTGFKGALFKRHLRSLDARRSLPRPSLSKIAALIDPKTNAGKDNTALNKVGTRYVTQAKKMAASYRNMLIL